MLVELDAFSGRQNPRWYLDAEHADELRGLLSQLTVSGGDPVSPPGLGYRGFIVRDATGTYRVYRGRVRTPVSLLADPSHSIERFLLKHVPDAVAPLGRRIIRELEED